MGLPGHHEAGSLLNASHHRGNSALLAPDQTESFLQAGKYKTHHTAFFVEAYDLKLEFPPHGCTSLQLVNNGGDTGGSGSRTLTLT